MFDLYTRIIKENAGKLFIIIFPLWMTPNLISLLSLLTGLLSCILLAYKLTHFAFFFWILSRFYDGMDGVVARKRGLQSEFGGYLDIICDFIVYSGVPIAVTSYDPSTDKWLWTCILLSTFFVNAASLFYLAGICEKISSLKGEYTKNKELTSLTMPPALIEGTESVILFSIMIIIPEYSKIIYIIFSGGVSVNIMQRLVWAWRNLPRKKDN